MAADLREVLGKYVPQAVLDQALEEIKDTEVSPEWYRAEAAKLGAAAKRAEEAEARLASIESGPKRREALQRVGIDYDAVPKYGQKALDQLPVDALDDIEQVAQYVQEQGFEATIQPTEQTGEKSGAEQMTDFLTSAGQGAPASINKDTEFQKELDAAPDMDSAKQVLAKYGRLANAGAEAPQ